MSATDTVRYAIVLMNGKIVFVVFAITLGQWRSYANKVGRANTRRRQLFLPIWPDLLSILHCICYVQGGPWPIFPTHSSAGALGDEVRTLIERCVVGKMHPGWSLRFLISRQTQAGSPLLTGREDTRWKGSSLSLCVARNCIGSSGVVKNSFLKGMLVLNFFHAMANGCKRRCMIQTLRWRSEIITEKEPLQCYIYVFYQEPYGKAEGGGAKILALTWGDDARGDG